MLSEQIGDTKRLKHKPALAVFLSVIPGLGQFYNKRYIKGTIFLVLFCAFITFFHEFINIGFWGLFTLGTIPELDDSRTLMIQGIVSLILVIFMMVGYVINLIDAKRDAEKMVEGFSIPAMRDSFQNTWDKGFPYFLVLPGFFLLILVVIIPLLFMVCLAFTNYDLYNSPPAHLLDWVGFNNFIRLFTDEVWLDSLLSVLSWTIVWTFVATSLQIALAFFLAVIVNDPRVKFKRLIRTVFILPWAVPAFVTILVFAAMFNENFGAINQSLLEPLGIFIPWLTDPFWAKVAIIIIQVWLGFPFVFALITGVLQSISNDWYEAADMDGGTRLQKFRFITFPHVMYATAPLLIMQYTFNFNNFNIIYLFNEGGPPVRGQLAGGTDILISWVYKLTFENSNYSMAAAISLIMGLIVVIFALYQFRRTRSFKEEDLY